MKYPTTLEDLEALLDAALRPQDVFGENTNQGFRRLSKLCHPDRYNGSDRAILAADLFRRLNEWRQRVDIALPPIQSGKRAYTILRAIGSGDLCSVYLAESGSEKYVLKVPRTTNHNNVMAKEQEVLAQIKEIDTDDLYPEYVADPVETFVADRRRINVFTWVEGLHTAEVVHDKYSVLEGRHISWMFRRVLEVLGYVHRKGWIHGAVLPPHLLFDVSNHGLKLLDWIHAEKIGTQIRIAPRKYKDWYPPECAGTKKKGADTSTDIYLAAKTMIHLMGGDPIKNEMPDEVPRPLRAFFRGCVVESRRSRPRDAWELHKELGILLESVYGSPKFVHLDMT